MNRQKFNDFLLRQVPKWDSEIIQDIRPLEFIPIGRDVRLLSNMERTAYSLRHCSIRFISKRLGVSAYRAKKLVLKVKRELPEKVEKWLSGLPAKKREREVKLRSGWIGHVKCGTFTDCT